MKKSQTDSFQKIQHCWNHWINWNHTETFTYF